MDAQFAELYRISRTRLFAYCVTTAKDSLASATIPQELRGPYTELIAALNAFYAFSYTVNFFAIERAINDCVSALNAYSVHNYDYALFMRLKTLYDWVHAALHPKVIEIIVISDESDGGTTNDEEMASEDEVVENDYENIAESLDLRLRTGKNTPRYLNEYFLF